METQRDRPIGAKAQRANPALEALSFLIGEWETTGTHPAMPEETLPGRTSFAWSEGGAFLVMRSETDQKDFPDGLAIFASDNVLDQVTLCWFDQRGVSRLCPVVVGERTLSWRHDDPDFMQRITLTADADGKRMTSRGEMAKDGAAWGPDLSQVFVRSKRMTAE